MLDVEFVSGVVCRYYGVGPDVFEGFRAARSKGAFFNRHIKDAYPWEYVKGWPAAASSDEPIRRGGKCAAGGYHRRRHDKPRAPRMVSSNQPNLHDVDWSKIPAPQDDGGARHLTGLAVPDVALTATDGTQVSLAKVPGRVAVFAYPRTGVPGQISPVPDWDMIPGARGCTPHACAFRDLHKEFSAAGAARVFGLSTQDTAYQREAAERLHLPFPLLSDERLALAKALRLPTMQVGGMTLIRRLALVIDDGTIATVFYPVFPPDRNAADVLAWLRQNGRP